MVHHDWHIADSADCAACGLHEDQVHILLGWSRTWMVWYGLSRFNGQRFGTFSPYIWQVLPFSLLSDEVQTAALTAILWNIWKA
jgi:hypothetical protein